MERCFSDERQNPVASISSAASLFMHEPLVDRTILADGLPHLFGGPLVRAFVRASGRTGHDFGPDAPRLPVVVGDIGVHGGQAPLGLLVGLTRVGDEVALAQDVGDGPVSHLYGSLRVVYEDSLDLSPLLFIATAALFGERFDSPLHAAAPLPEFPLGLFLGASLLCRPLELGAELFPAPLPLLLAPLRSPPPRSEEQRQQQDHDDSHHYDHDQGRSAHISSCWFLSCNIPRNVTYVTSPGLLQTFRHAPCRALVSISAGQRCPSGTSPRRARAHRSEVLPRLGRCPPPC